MHPLAGPRLRVRRVREEFDLLHKEFELVTQQNQYTITADDRLKRGRYTLRVTVDERKPVDPMWAVRLGEMAHNLRAALDGLYWQMALRGPCSEFQLLKRHPQVGFPIFTSDKGRTVKWCNKAIQDRIEVLPGRPKSWRTDVARLQPYKRRNLNKRSPLWLLHELNNADKHRLVQFVFAQTAFVGWAGWLADSDPPPRFHIDFRVPLIDGTKVGWADRRLVEEMQVKHMPVTALVAFGEGCPPVRGARVQGLFPKITDAVDNIIEGFSDSFS